MARLQVEVLPVRRAVPPLPVALGRQAVRLRDVWQAVLAVRPPSQARARPLQADGRGGRDRGPAEAVAAAATATVQGTRPSDRGRYRGAAV